MGIPLSFIINTGASVIVNITDRPVQKLCFLLWGISCVASGLMLRSYEELRPFDEQSLIVKLGAITAATALVIAALFGSYLLWISIRARSIEPALILFPWPARHRVSVTFFSILLVLCVTFFLVFAAILLNVMLP